MRQLQAEWKTIGPVRKSKSEAVWQRFRTACDRFFDRYKHRDQVELAAKAAPRDSVVRELEALLPADGDAGRAAPPDGLYAVIQRGTRAVAAGAGAAAAPAAGPRGALSPGARPARGAWPAAFSGTDLDPETTRKRMEKLVAKVEECLNGSGGKAGRAASCRRPSCSRSSGASGSRPTRLRAAAARENEEARWRAAEQDVRSAQAQWMRLGPVPADVAGPLNERFQRACRRFYDQRKRAS